MYSDYHVHSSYSDDSTYPMEDIIKRAIDLGMNEICFTEHVDYGVKVDINSNPSKMRSYYPKTKSEIEMMKNNCNYSEYILEYNRCKRLYKDKINIKLGIEFGMQVNTIDCFKVDFDRYDFDFVILSCHQIEDKEFYNYRFQEGKTQAEYNRAYYQEILNVIKEYKDYSVLGHLDMIKRYDKVGIYPFEAVKDIVTEILKQVIKDSKGIEINTSSFRYALSDLTPSIEIIKLYKELGGKIITIGSDSHEEDHLGYKILDVKRELKELGFEYFCTFNKMEPIFHRL
ncbi:histidinol-phosphatase HisJ family protein [Ilyobacter sp.]|uniref:histidinol-phosphatase HisJ family protein n=1 Tax=Ilyobacter sp. TaxID=3100343 RepID=UPI00356AC1DD